MRQHLAVILVVAGLLAATILLLGGSLFSSGAEPPLRWRQDEEIVVTPPADDPAAAETAPGDVGREALAVGAPDDLAGERVEVVLRGRVVDPFRAPVADASVRLDFARGGPRDAGGRQRRVPDAATTDADGRFAFQGLAFRDLRVTLLVVHPAFAPGWFERNLGESRAEMELGDLQVSVGGALLGRVTDLDGNGVPLAEVRLQAENGNLWRGERDREALFAAQSSDRNGYYRLDRVPAGDWRVLATASRHERGASEVVGAVDGQRIEVDDIRLGPGYGLAGIVTDRAGTPLPDARVSARPRRQGREARPGRPGGEHRASTDANGRFLLDHLPGVPIDLLVERDGYLRHDQREIDARLELNLHVALQDGLAIRGTVVDAATGAPVELFAVLALRLRGLPTPAEQNELNELAQRARNLDDERQLQQGQWRLAEEAVRARGRAEAGNPARGFDADPGQPVRHPGGRFTATGLQEGVYALVVHSPAHARHRGGEFELRADSPPPGTVVALQRGFTVRGVVRGRARQPLAGAQVELRAQPAEGGPGGRGGDAARWFTGFGALDTRTDGDGRFAIEHATPGRYRVVASAPRHDQALTDPFQLEADLEGVMLELGRLGALRGRVLGADPAAIGDVRVVAVPVDERGGPMLRFRSGGPFANVQADGGYRFDDLAPGGYAVRATTAAGMRLLFTQFIGGPVTADVAVRGGETSTFDVTLTLPELGEVGGSVLHNGEPAVGFRIGLQRHDGNDPALPPGAGGRGGRGGPGRMGMQLDATVGATGRFTIENVPAGSYRLTVSSARRGSVLHSEPVFVQARTTSEVTISLATAAIAGQVTADDGTPAAELDGGAMLLPGLTEVPADLGALRREGSFTTRVQDGRFEIDLIPSGSYLVLVTIRGRERAAALVFASLGQRTELSVTAGKKAAPGQEPQPGAVPGGGAPPPARGPGRNRRGG
jgi:protocatechuate 3,4-dioxygenase beta subunit